MMRRVRWITVLAVLCILPLLIGAVLLQRSQAASQRADEAAALTGAADAEAQRLAQYFGEARKLITYSARSSDFTGFYAAPGSRAAKVAAGGIELDRAVSALGAFERLYPDGIGEACFIDRNGPEVARVTKGERAPVSDLSPDESESPFFAATFALRPGQAYQARPYLSPDTSEWVISNSAALPKVGGTSPAFVHFEISIESFRRQAAKALGTADLQVVDAHSGRVVFNAAKPQRTGTKTLGAPASAWSRAAVRAGGAQGIVTAGGRRAAYVRLPHAVGNANEWTVVAVARTPVATGLHAIGLGPLGLLIGSLLLLAGLAVVALFSRDVARRATTFAGVAERLSRGDLSETVPEGREDELGVLARALNHVVDTYLRRLAVAAERIAGGDLSERIEPVSDADTLGHAFAAMADNLAATVGGVRQAAGSVTSASRDMASGSGESSRAIEELAGAVGEVARSAEDQARLLERARADAGEAAREAAGSAEAAAGTQAVAVDAGAAARRGVDAAARAGTAMDAVRETTTATAEGIRALAATSSRIGAIVDTITGIAEQTNLLALNAAIEAARAGDQGRGFAVVADEVRKLAEESQDAAAEIAGLISEIQRDTRGVVEVVEHNAQRTEDGIATVDETREMLAALGTAVDQVNERVAVMAGATERIAGRLAGIEGGMDEAAVLAQQASAAAEQMSAATEQSSATSQQLAASAQDMAVTAAALERAVDRFTLGV